MAVIPKCSRNFLANRDLLTWATVDKSNKSNGLSMLRSIHSVSAEMSTDFLATFSMDSLEWRAIATSNAFNRSDDSSSKSGLSWLQPREFFKLAICLN